MGARKNALLALTFAAALSTATSMAHSATPDG
jgi:hypothetical protein